MGNEERKEPVSVFCLEGTCVCCDRVRDASPEETLRELRGEHVRPRSSDALCVDERVRVIGGAWQSAIGKLATVRNVYQPADDGSRVIQIDVDDMQGTLSLAASDVERCPSEVMFAFSVDALLTAAESVLSHGQRPEADTARRELRSAVKAVRAGRSEVRRG